MRIRSRLSGLPSPNLEEAGRCIRCLPGRVVVQMAAIEHDKRGLWIPGKTARRFRANVGVVLACAPRIKRWENGLPIYEYMDIAPGEVVLVHPKDGKRVAGARFGSYVCETEVAYLGIVCELKTQPVEMPWFESILGKVDMVSETIRPVQTSVKLELGEKRSATSAGILLPDGAKDRTDVATVLEVGNMVRDVKPGDRVAYERGAMAEIFIDDELTTTALIDEQGIYCVLE